MEAEMSTKTYVDGLLVDWGSRVFNGTPVKVTSTKAGMTGISKPKAPKGGGSFGQSSNAKEIRSKLGSIAKRTPEVVVRISGGGKGMKHIKAHLDYITRNGQIEAEDQNGDKLSGKDDVDALKGEWRDGGFPIPEDDGTRREAFNIILSMPAGTNEEAVKGAVRDFAAVEFEGFQYVMALHTFDTDPDPEPSPNPHVHLAVKATGLDGIRLNPRKADLQRWREGFAKALRDRGVDATATKRVQRLSLPRGEKQAVRQKRERGEQFDKVGRAPASAERVAKAKRTEEKVLYAYGKMAKALATSDDVEDRKLAAGLVHALNENKPRPAHSQEPEKGVDR
jgi:hypothetical protein